MPAAAGPSLSFSERLAGSPVVKEFMHSPAGSGIVTSGKNLAFRIREYDKPLDDRAAADFRGKAIKMIGEDPHLEGAYGALASKNPAFDIIKNPSITYRNRDKLEKALREAALRSSQLPQIEERGKPIERQKQAPVPKPKVRGGPVLPTALELLSEHKPQKTLFEQPQIGKSAPPQAFGSIDFGNFWKKGQASELGKIGSETKHSRARQLSDLIQDVASASVYSSVKAYFEHEREVCSEELKNGKAGNAYAAKRLVEGLHDAENGLSDNAYYFDAEVIGRIERNAKAVGIDPAMIKLFDMRPYIEKLLAEAPSKYEEMIKELNSGLNNYLIDYWEVDGGKAEVVSVEIMKQSNNMELLLKRRLKDSNYRKRVRLDKGTREDGPPEQVTPAPSAHSAPLPPAPQTPTTTDPLAAPAALLRPAAPTTPETPGAEAQVLVTQAPAAVHVNLSNFYEGETKLWSGVELPNKSEKESQERNSLSLWLASVVVLNSVILFDKESGEAPNYQRKTDLTIHLNNLEGELAQVGISAERVQLLDLRPNIRTLFDAKDEEARKEALKNFSITLADYLVSYAGTTQQSAEETVAKNIEPMGYLKFLLRLPAPGPARVQTQRSETGHLDVENFFISGTEPLSGAASIEWLHEEADVLGPEVGTVSMYASMHAHLKSTRNGHLMPNYASKISSLESLAQQLGLDPAKIKLLDLRNEMGQLLKTRAGPERDAVLRDMEKKLVLYLREYVSAKRAESIASNVSGEFGFLMAPLLPSKTAAVPVPTSTIAGRREEQTTASATEAMQHERQHLDGLGIAEGEVRIYTTERTGAPIKPIDGVPVLRFEVHGRGFPTQHYGTNFVRTNGVVEKYAQMKTNGEKLTPTQESVLDKYKKFLGEVTLDEVVAEINENQ